MQQLWIFLFFLTLCYVIPDAAKNGVAQETIQNTIRRASKGMTEQEARQILGVSAETPWEEVIKVSISFMLWVYY